MPGKYFIILIMLLLLSFKGKCQNLFPDPGFEEVTVTQKEKKYYYNYEHWARLLPFGDWGNGLGLPKFSIYQSRDTFNGRYDNNWNPHTGDSYFINTFPHTPNLYQAELIQPLRKDSVYHFEIYHKVFINRLIDTVFIKGQLGVWFTNTDFRDSVNLELLKNGKIKYKPHIWLKKIEFSEILNNTTDENPVPEDPHNHYHLFRQTFTPDRDYKYAVVGNHQPFLEWGVEMFRDRKSLGYRLDDIYIGLQPNHSALNENTESKSKHNSLIIFFDSNSSKLSEIEVAKLDQFVTLLPDTIRIIELNGHTDYMGPESSNLELSRHRAESIGEYLKQKGIPEKIITIQSFGKSQANSNSNSKEIKAKDRKVEIIVRY